MTDEQDARSADGPDANRLMQSLLVEAGFEFDRPDPRLAWECFKRFIHLALPGVSTTTISFECTQVDDRDDVLWLSFMRHLEQGEYGLCGCLLRRTASPEMIGVNDGNYWWAEHGTLQTWANDVEWMPTFIRCLTLDGWSWEGFNG